MGQIKLTRTDDGRWCARLGSDFCVADSAREAQYLLGRHVRRNGRTNQVRFSRPLSQSLFNFVGAKNARMTKNASIGISFRE